ncbi:hypothetical protein BRADI_3g47366v3 [Brachypodium distachyon]|uniref:Uncharacterized protein n=1 Tax=Brachypodium distachyon TaxID=15368 RepID=A0A2K2D3T6_BRADI|nr:hypothetical protein BRADI_3g47366v3 [Brachypodium distachyon]
MDSLHLDLALLQGTASERNSCKKYLARLLASNFQARRRERCSFLSAVHCSTMLLLLQIAKPGWQPMVVS